MPTYHFSNNPHPTARGTNTKISTVNHYRYITREGQYSHGNGREDDLVYAAHGNMPEWAKTPEDFWQAAEDHRRANGRAYREIRMALPEELSLHENVALVERFLEESGIKDKHAYSYVIHDKIAAFDEEHRNIHCHLMFNEREIEKDRPLGSAEEFFSRYSPTLGNRETGEGKGKVSGGYKVSTHYSDKNTTIALRKSWETILNDGLKKNNIDARVSCETLEKQKEVLEEKGDQKNAELLNRPSAPRLNYGYKNPVVMKKIRERISHYKTALDSDVGFSNEPEESNVIDLFAKDVALRQKARQIQYAQKMAMKGNKELAEDEYNASFKDDPMVVTTGDLRKSFLTRHEELLKKAEELTSRYESVKGDIIPEKYIGIIALNYITDGRYSESQKEYQNASKAYRAERARDEELVSDPIAYKRHIEKLTVLRQERTSAWNEWSAYKALEGSKEALSVEEDIRAMNAEREKESRTLYGQIMNTDKLLSATTEALEKLKGIPDDHIAYAEKLPSLLTRKNKLDGITPLKDLPTLTYKGQIYIITDNKDPLHPRGVKLYSEVEKGRATLYQFTRSDNGGKLRTTGIKEAGETVKLYKEHSQKADGKGAMEHTAANGQMIERQSKSMLDEIMDNRVRSVPKNEKIKGDVGLEKSEDEQYVDDMIAEWNRRLNMMNIMKGKKAIVQKVEREHQK